MDELLSEFITETNEQIEAAAAQLIAFEREPSNTESIASIYRLVHTIKGTCGFLDLNRLLPLAHAAETLIARIRDRQTASPQAVSLILAAIDRVRYILEVLEATGAEPSDSDADLIATLESMADEAGDTASPNGREAADPVGEFEASASALEDARRQHGSIRVAVPTVERIMRLVSELVLTRNQLMEIARHSNAGDLALPLQRLSVVTSDLQDGIMRVRMQPIARLFSSMPRLVRDLSLELGKKIDLLVEGSDTEFDRQLVELLRTPLVHIIRNCADHGIEEADQRVAAGKPATGRIQVSATHEASHITIEIADDGRGLDIARIRAQAVALGLSPASDIAAMSGDEVCDFIFAPGFSTADSVTHVSGRGMGMDIVRQTVESIGGTISISSQPGLGTAFKLKLPLTLAIAPALIVTARGHRFALPQHSVLEAVATRPGGTNHLSFAQTAPMLHLREKILPILDLSIQFGLSSGPMVTEEERLVVVVRSGAATFGVAVDAVADIQEVVVKPLGPSIARIPGFAGNTILGDGSVILILDVAGLAGSLGLATSSTFRRAPAVEEDLLQKEISRLILFRAGDGPNKAMPLSQVSRIENVTADEIETAGGRLVVRRGDTIMPLAAAWPLDMSAKRQWPILVIGVAGEPMGLIVSEIIDIVDAAIRIDIAGSREGILGAMVLDGQTTEFIDVAHYMQVARPGAFQRGHARAFNVLLVDDKLFFRDLLTPVISAAGYEVTAVASAGEALHLVERGVHFDAVITDIDMPDLDGYALARALHKHSNFGDRPILAIDAYAGATVEDAARSAGIQHVIGKFDRQTLTQKLRAALDADIAKQAVIEQSVASGEAA